MTTTANQTAILRNFPATADAYDVWCALEPVIARTPKDGTEAALLGLILDLRPIYSKFAGRRITLQPDCPFVSLVAATARACGWSASRQTICDLEMRMSRPAPRRAFGTRAA